MQHSICDLTTSIHDSCGWPLRDALKRVSESECGVVVILRKHETSADIIRRLNLLGADAERPEEPAVTRKDLREIGVGAQILCDLGVHKMRVLSAPVKMHALSGFGLEVVEYVG